MTEAKQILDDPKLEEMYEKFPKFLSNLQMELIMIPMIGEILMADLKNKDQEKFFKIKFATENLKDDLKKALELMEKGILTK